MKKIFIVVCILFVLSSQSFAMNNKTTGYSKWDETYQIVSNYGEIIARASELFNIPQQIIIGVILKESGGDNFARAKTTSAKGLMQTIDSTFKIACSALIDDGIKITRDPFNPTASILAGSWYLDRMYNLAAAEFKADPYKRQNVRSWKTALEYYYAGPQNEGRIKEKKEYSDSVIYTASNLFTTNQSDNFEYTVVRYKTGSYFLPFKQTFDKGFD